MHQGWNLSNIGEEHGERREVGGEEEGKWV
jgi:hypothetical protein